MRISTFRNFGAMNSPPVFDAFTQSVKKKGWEVVDHDMSADVAVIWSVLWNGRMFKNKDVWNHFRKQGKPVIVLEVGGLDRGILWKVAVNGINGDGYFGPKENDDKRRKKLNIWPKPWYKTHDIIICSQHGNSHQWDGMPPISQWIEETISKLRTYTDRKIIIRPHPRFSYNRQDFFKDIVVEYPREITSTYDSFNFEEKLKTAWAIVNWNSNPATQAAIDGVPVFVGPSSLAAPVGNLDWSKIENPDTPDREQWVNDIAYTEWSVDEISGGEPLDRLSQALHY
jgi:hypothetical protein